MKSLLKLLVGVGMFALVAPVLAEAQGGRGHAQGMEHGHGKGLGHGQGVEKRIENQKRRIKKGLEKGKLTQEQAAALEANVDKIKADKDAAMADGKISKEEREKLKSELKASGQEIHNEKHPEKPTQPSMPSVPAPTSSPAQ